MGELEQNPIKLEHAPQAAFGLSVQAKGGLGNHPNLVRSDTALASKSPAMR